MVEVRKIFFLIVCGMAFVHAAPGPLQEKIRPASLEWLAGSWSGSDGTTKVEEYWMRPAAGVMLGIHRDVDSAGFVWFEYLRIETHAGGMVYAAMPGGRPAVQFALKEGGRNHVVFENLENDFPQRIIYRLHEDGSLLARIEGVQDGAVRSKEWVWRKTMKREE